MGWLDLAINPPARWSASDAAPPLRLAEETAAQQTLRTYPVRALPTEKPQRKVVDVLRSGYAPGSAGDRAFAALHRVERWDDPANPGELGDRIFNASNIRRQRPRSSVPETYDGNLREGRPIDDDIYELAMIYGATLDETLAGLDRVKRDHGLSLREAVDALLRGDGEPLSLEERRELLRLELNERVRAQLQGIKSGIRAAAGKAPVGGVESAARRKPRRASTAAGGQRPDHSFKPSGRGSDGVSTTPETQDHVREHVSARSFAELYRDIRAKGAA